MALFSHVPQTKQGHYRRLFPIPHLRDRHHRQCGEDAVAGVYFQGHGAEQPLPNRIAERALRFVRALVERRQAVENENLVFSGGGKPYRISSKPIGYPGFCFQFLSLQGKVLILVF